MKNFLNLFYTRPAKAVYILIFLFLALLIGEYQIGYFSLFSEDKESFINAMTQMDSFDYENSYYFTNTVKNSIDDVITLSMDYKEVFENGDNKKSIDELLDYYRDIGDHTFLKIYENLSKMSGFKFALINYGDSKVYSNIDELNIDGTEEEIKKVFSQQGKTLLIARSCKNPYFATNAFIDFAEHIRSCAGKYEDNFDLYIYFGSVESFEMDELKYEQLHFKMRNRIEKLNDQLIVCIAFVVFIGAVILSVSGKLEPNGKTYATVMNKIPNDLMLLICAIVIYCLSTLYRLAVFMLINHGSELDEFWFTPHEDFYIGRIRVCIVIIMCVILNLLCVLKRSYKMGNLVENTYLYHFYLYIKNHLKIKRKKDQKES